jgi:hypothetical protein
MGSVVHYVPGTNITFTMEPGVVHIDNDSYLETVLDNGIKTPYEIASAIKSKYKSVYGVGLDIATDSLSLEIVGHVYPGEVAEYVKSKSFVPDWIKEVADEVIVHTSVIDCGEEDKDSNRIVWDTLADLIDAIIFID